MRTIEAEAIASTVADMCIKAATNVDCDTLRQIAAAKHLETSESALAILKQIEENAAIAQRENKPACQDCGTAVIFAEVGQDVHIEGSFEDAIHSGVANGYGDGYLRKSICHYFTRANTGDNTPAIIHTRLVKGDKLKLTLLLKGGGAENVSALKMLVPAAGKEGVFAFVMDTVRKAGPNPCPPMVIGVGIGGNFETAPLMAKLALAEPAYAVNPDGELAELEAELLTAINNLNIGPGGFGGKTSALSVHIKAAPCHIASLPCAVNINCHSVRHESVIL